jgi:DNA-binding NarL/FixJ family response regulator
MPDDRPRTAIERSAPGNADACGNPADAPDTKRSAIARPGALISGPDVRDRIAALLSEQGVRAVPFASVAELQTAPADQCPALIAISLDRVSSSLAKRLQSLRASFEQAPILIVCRQIERWEMRSMLGCGVSGVVLEDELARAFGPCVRSILADQICVPKRHWRTIEPPVLSSREKQVLGLVVMGYMNGQIAQHLFLAESTVKSHLSSAFTKLGVRSRNEAVELILNSEHGLGLGILALGTERLQTTETSLSGGGSRAIVSR